MDRKRWKGRGVMSITAHRIGSVMVGDEATGKRESALTRVN